MFKQWFAQYNWAGLSLLGFLGIVYICYLSIVKKSLAGKKAIIYAASIVGVFFLLYLFGLRW